MRYFLDTEFNGFNGHLISLALVGEDGGELYIATECRKPLAWVVENVLPIVYCHGAEPAMIGPNEFGREIAAFFYDDELPVIVADWPDDIKYFCQALITGPGEMVAIRQLKFEIIRVDAYPTELEGAIQHNALWDARALKLAVEVSRVVQP